MTFRRVAVYLAGATLLAAWLSSADSLTPRRQSPPPETRMETEPADDLAREVRDEVRRLRTRLAVAPRPHAPLRDPFRFHAAGAADLPSHAVRPVASAGALPAAHPAISEPLLELVGIAEERRGEDRVRTAMIVSGDSELVMAAPGETLLGRYRVVTVGSASVELSDTLTGSTRRLVLH
jgi:hypothetical protein